MLKKQRKWLSWALVVALLLSLLPANVQPVQAATYTNATLEAAANSITNKSLPVLNLSGKSIAGAVNVGELKGTDANQFPNLARVNLQGNFITKITASPGITVVSDNNLFDPANTANLSAKAKLKELNTDPIVRKKNTPTPIKINDIWEGIVSQQSDTLTLKELVAKGVVEKITLEYYLNGVTTPQSVATTSLSDVNNVSLEIPQTDVPNLDPAHKVKVIVKYKDITQTTEVEKAIDLRVPTFKIEGLTDGATLYRGVSKVDVTITKIDEDGNVLDIPALSDVTLAPGALTVVAGSEKLVNADGTTATANGKAYKATLEVPATASTGPATVAATVNFAAPATPVTKNINVTIAEADFATFQLVELKQNPDGTEAAGTQDSDFFPAYTGTGAGASAPGLYMLAGTSVASFNQTQYGHMLNGTSTGKFFIKVPNGTGGYRFLRPDETSLITVIKPGDSLTPGGTNVDKGYGYTIGNKDGKAYLTFSSEFRSESGSAQKYIIGLNTTAPAKPKLTIQGVTLQKVEPEGFYIYEFDKETSDDGTITAKISQTPDNSIYYVANSATSHGHTQDTVKMTRPINLIEGQEKVLIPVAEYIVNGQKVRQIIPNIKKFWYQKEDNNTDKNFDTVPKRIRPVSSAIYGLDADGYPVSSGGTNTPYRGAPITAYLPSAGNLTNYGGPLIVSGQAMATPAEDKFANIVLSLSGTNNPVGFWFQVNWTGKKVSNYVLVKPTYSLPTVNNLDSLEDLDTTTPGVQTFKENLEAALKKVDELDHPLTKTPGTKEYKIGTKQKVSVPIGEVETLKILAIYDNGKVEEFSGSVRDKTELIAQAGFQNGDIVINNGGTASEVKFVATDRAGVKEVAGLYTDGRANTKADFNVKGTTDSIAEVILAPSLVKNVLWIANDDKMLALNLDNPLKTGDITKGTWKGNLVASGLGPADPPGAANNPNIYVGNSSWNPELSTRVYVLPVYGNKDLSFDNIVVNGADDPDLKTKLAKFAWDPGHWTSDITQPVGYTQDGRGFKVETAGDSGRMAEIQSGIPRPLALELGAGITDLNGHKIDNTTLPAGHHVSIVYNVLPAIYDRIGAIREVVDTATPTNYLRKEIDNNDDTKVIEVGSDAATAEIIRIKLTNSNLFGAQTLSYNKGEFDYGVYFYGTGETTSATSDVLKTPSMVGPTAGTTPPGNELTGAAQTYKDIAMLTHLSGYKIANAPATYVTNIKAGANPYTAPETIPGTSRLTTLQDEANKIKPVVYKKVTTGSTTTFVDAGTEVTIAQAAPNTPGTYKIHGNQRGVYYVTFNTVNGYPGYPGSTGPISPLVQALKDIPAGQPLAPETDITKLQNYTAQNDTYWFKIAVNSAPIGTIYNYVPGTNKAAVNDEGKVVVTLDDNETFTNFDVYPVIIDKWFIDQKLGGNAPAKLDKAAKDAIAAAAGAPDFETVLNTPYSGVSYMTTADFKFNAMRPDNWLNGNSNLITAAAVDTEQKTINGHAVNVIKQQVRVEKGRIANKTVGLQASNGDFNNLPTPAPAGTPAALIASPSSYTPAAAPVVIAPVEIVQKVDAVLQDIVVDPTSNVQINSGGTAKFRVQYRTDDNELVAVTADNLTNSAAAYHYLDVQQLSGPTGATLVKQAPVGSTPAELQFTATEVGIYKYKLQTKNTRGALIPNLADGKIISFTVVPSIRSNYELWVGDELTVDLGSDLNLADVEFEPTPNNVLDPAKLAQGKLAIDPNWPNIGNPTNQTETVEVKIKKDGDYLGTLKFDVVCHPRGNATYSIEPVTIFDDNETHVSPAGPVELDRAGNDNFLVRVKKTYDDDTFEYVDATDINLTNQGIYDANGTTDTNDFLTFAPSGDKAVKATLSSTLPVDTETWYGLWEATIDGQTLQLHVRLNKAGDAADPRPAVDYKIYELSGNNLTDVTGTTVTFKLNEREKYLFVVNEANAGAPVIADDASISLDNNSTLNYRLMPGTTTTIAGGNTNDLKANPANYTRIRVTPRATGTVTVSATDTYQATTAAVEYKVIDPANVLKVNISGEPTAPVAKDTAVTLTATAVGGNDPGNYSYQWQESNDGNNWIDIAGETTTTLPVATSALGTHFYRVVVTKGSEVANSPSASVTVVAATPTPSTVTAAFATNPVSANLGGTASFNVVVSGAQPTDTITYEWTAKNPANNVVTALTETSDTLTLSNLTAADMAQEYYVKVKVNGTVVTTVGPGKLAQGLINITFNLGDGTVVDPSGAAVSTVVKAYAANQVIASSDIPVPTAAAGKTFVGWAPADPANHTVVAPKTFTAVYNTSTAPAGQSEIKFYVGNGTITSGNATLYKPSGATIAASEVPTVTAPTGYKFTGWDTNPVSYTVGGNKTFVAQYRALNNYQVTFVLGQGTHVSGSPALVQTIQEDHVIQANEVPGVQAPAAANFTGWSPSNPVGHKVVGNITFTATFTTTGGGGGGGGGGGAIVPPTPTPTPTPTPSTSTTTKPAELPPVELDQNYKFAYIHGYPGQVVRASGAITRAEVAAIFSRLLKEKMDESKTYTSSFSDIKAGKWYSNPIGYLEGFKIISGYQDGTFKPDKQLTRAEFASVISRFAKLDTTKKTNFSDVSSNHWAKDYIDNAISHGWMGGYPDGTFKPNQPITRAEIVTVINKLINRTPDKAAIDGNSANATRFKDLSKTYWAYYDVIEASTDR